MRKHCPENERIKRRYLQYLKEAKRLAPHSVDKAAAAIGTFERLTNYRSFKQFHIEQVVAFKKKLGELKNERTGRPISKATLSSTLRALKVFAQWLSEQPGYRSRLNYSDAEYFNLSAKDTRIAHAVREGPSPSMEQALHALGCMPASTEVERRNRAIFAFLLLTAARDGAVISLKLKHVDLIEGCIYQDAREVNTKGAKTFVTFFFPVDQIALNIFVDWVKYLREVKLFGPDDPLFPSGQSSLGAAGQFTGSGITRQHWATASALRGIVKAAFRDANVQEFGPHSFRKTLTRFGIEKCLRVEDMKAWSENLGHEHLQTTMQSYGKLGPARQAETMRRLR